MTPHQQRVMNEKVELDDRIQKLIAFFSTGTFDGLDEYEKALLRMQANTMLTYSGLLELRISQFHGASA